MSIELTNKQKEGLEITLQRYQENQTYTVISGYAGSGKAQPITTIIPTPNGMKQLKDLKIGDYVFDRFGKPTKVLGIFPQGKIDNYKVTLEDGRETFCNEEHIWSYYTSKGNLKEITTKEMLKKGLKMANRGGYRYKIPTSSLCPVEFNSNNYLPIDPYVVGVFLGDGCCKQRLLTLSSNDEYIVEEVSRLIESDGYVKNSDKSYNWTFLVKEDCKEKEKNPLITKIQTKYFFKPFLKEIVTNAEDKRIPECYKYSSIQDRLNLIQGLLDTDGTIGENDNHRYNISFTSTSLNLIKDLREVLFSLGYESSISKNKRVDNYTTGTCYNLSINIPNEEKYKLFRLPRKKNIALKAKNYNKRRDYGKVEIVSIEKMDEQEEMLCLYVENEEHLYLTNDYIVTHNTTLVRSAIDALPISEEEVVYTSFTGKATLILKEKGNQNTMTLHKLLYEHKPKPNGDYIRIPKDSIGFKVVVVDEVSMVPEDMMDLLFSHRGVYVICLGDPAQLSPVSSSSGNHLLDNPHVFLDEIMRQAQDSEIIKLTMDIRAGKKLEPMNGNEVKIIRRKDLNTGMLLWADQIIVATNKERDSINKQVRELLGRGEEPEESDKIICQKNYWNHFSNKGNPLLNGLTGTIKNVYTSTDWLPRWLEGGKGITYLQGIFETAGGEKYPIWADKKMINTGKKCIEPQTEYRLGKKNKKYYLPKAPLEFLYGYAISCWKAQGSEWDKVLVLEEGFPWNKDEHKRFLYTAATRAREKLVIVLKD